MLTLHNCEVKVSRTCLLLTHILLHVHHQSCVQYIGQCNNNIKVRQFCILPNYPHCVEMEPQHVTYNHRIFQGHCLLYIVTVYSKRFFLLVTDEARLKENSRRKRQDPGTMHAINSWQPSSCVHTHHVWYTLSLSLSPTPAGRSTSYQVHQERMYSIPYSWKCLWSVKFCSLQFWQQSTNIISTTNFGARYICEVSTMSLLRYFSWTSSLPFLGSVPSLTPEPLHEANQRVSILSREPNEAGLGPKRTKNTCTWCN